MADIRTGSKYLDQVEQAIEQIQMKRDIPQNLELIRRMINLEFKATCEKVYLTDNNTQSYFFGVHVFPAKKELYNIADKVVKIDQKVQFTNCSEFVLELDSKLVYSLGATPREITAALLHEIGHKVYSKQAQIRSKIMFMNSAGKYLGIAGGLVKIASPLKFLLFSAILVTFSNSLNSYMRMKDELDADSFAVKYGYASDLHSLLGKMVGDGAVTHALSGRGFSLAKSTHANEETEKAVMQWSFKNIVDFSIRRGEILRALKAQLREEPSEYGREVLLEQIAQIEKSKPGRMGIRMSGSSMAKSEEAMLEESVKSFIEVQVKGMSHLELDEISVEIERIETHEDKIYIITRIYRNLAAANKTIEKIKGDNSNSGKARQQEFKDYVKSLKDMLERTKAIKVKETQYGVFIKYPQGDYEE
jgi:hypothetical protein